MKFIVDFNEQELGSLLKDERFTYFQKRNFLAFNNEHEDALKNEYSAVEEADGYGDIMDFQFFIESECEYGEGYLEVSNGIKVEYEEILDVIVSSKEFLESDMEENENPEQFFDNFINGTISQLATIQIIESIKQLEQNEGLFFELPFLQNTNLKEYKIVDWEANKKEILK